MENMPDNVKDNPVGKREALLADRLRLHKGYRYTEVEIFSKGDFTLGTNWFEGEVTGRRRGRVFPAEWGHALR